MQAKGPAAAQAMQAFRTWVSTVVWLVGSGVVFTGMDANVVYSGDKKTKGAALVF
jgi:hypothetical protein